MDSVVKCSVLESKLYNIQFFKDLNLLHVSFQWNLHWISFYFTEKLQIKIGKVYLTSLYSPNTLKTCFPDVLNISQLLISTPSLASTLSDLYSPGQYLLVTSSIYLSFLLFQDVNKIWNHLFFKCKRGSFFHCPLVYYFQVCIHLT